MRRKLLTALLTLVCSGAFAIETVPVKGSIISPSDKFIQYTGRISFANPERPAWNFLVFRLWRRSRAPRCA